MRLYSAQRDTLYFFCTEQELQTIFGLFSAIGGCKQVYLAQWGIVC